ncbi:MULTISPECIES: VMAP-C domain-containing protein [Streptomyces]|uniref:VMAP-C domain-containing protein n=1 Tax=Streptomyces TaxID=1883 RepID=UPI00117DB059|nr:MULTISPECIES: caspase family protein [Streptomyces]
MTLLPSGTRAVVVGVERYDIGSRWGLDGPAADACRFAGWLTSCGVPAENITLLVSPLASNADLVREHIQRHGYRSGTADQVTVREVFARTLPATTSDLLIIHWGGHGVIEHDEQRLIYADATTQDKCNLNLTQLLRSLRTSTYARHPRQLVLVDACSNLVEDLGWAGVMPRQDFAEGRTDPRRDQYALLAASPGERAVNDDAAKTGLFSRTVLEVLGSLSDGTWPPDAGHLQSEVSGQFELLREQGRTAQVPSRLWYRSRSTQDELIFAAGSPAARTSARAVGALLLTHGEFQRLKKIIDGASAPARLRDLYREATRDVVSASALLHQPDDLTSTVVALRNLVRPAPLFRFLVRFAASSDTVTQHRLWEWINETAPRWEVDLEELRALDAELCRTYMVLRLQPDLLGEGLLVTGWSYEGCDSRQVVCADEPWAAGRLASEVGRLLEGFDPELDAVPPVIEFLVHMPMLDDQLELLSVPIAGRRQAIGTACPVVMRPLERLTDPDRVQVLQARWRELTKRGDAYDASAIHWVECILPGTPANAETWQTRVCAALAYRRSHGPHEDPGLQEALAAGMPVALWHRPTRGDANRREALERVLRNRQLRDLPDVVLGQRIAAHHPSANADHPGRDLVLLWDDPDRLPAELQWHPPTLEGAAL